HHSDSRWPRTSEESPSRSRYCNSALHVIDFIGQPIKRGMTVDLVFGGIEHLGLRLRIARDDVIGAHHPDARALLAPRVNVARHLQREGGIGRVHAAAVLVIKPVAAS